MYPVGCLTEVDDADRAFVWHEHVVEQGVVTGRGSNAEGVPGFDRRDAGFAARDKGVHDLRVLRV